MRSSANDNESFKEAAGSLRFYNPPSDSNTLERVLVGSNSGVQPQKSPEENWRSEDTVPFRSISQSRVTQTFEFTKSNACHAVTRKMTKWF